MEQAEFYRLIVLESGFFAGPAGLGFDSVFQQVLYRVQFDQMKQH